MSIVTFQGGPVTHRYFMGKTKSWLAYEIMEMTRRLAKLRDDGVDPGPAALREAPVAERWALLAKFKEELASEALRLHREYVELLPAEVEGG